MPRNGLDVDLAPWFTISRRRHTHATLRVCGAVEQTDQFTIQSFRAVPIW